eukprot:gene19480-biopygen24395
MSDNHGGGYQYRLCPLRGEYAALREECSNSDRGSATAVAWQGCCDALSRCHFAARRVRQPTLPSSIVKQN